MSFPRNGMWLFANAHIIDPDRVFHRLIRSSPVTYKTPVSFTFRHIPLQKRKNPSGMLFDLRGVMSPVASLTGDDVIY